MSRFRGLWQASVNATKRALLWKPEDLLPPSERYIFKFDTKEELKRWHLYADSEFNGLSSASLQIQESTNGSSGIGVFSGNLSLDVAEGTKWNITRSGFCGMRSKKFDGFIDLDGYDTLALKLKGDGRCYISTIYTENWVNSPGQQEDNSWQAFVYVPKDNWYIAKASSLSLSHTHNVAIKAVRAPLKQITQHTGRKWTPTFHGTSERRGSFYINKVLAGKYYSFLVIRRVNHVVSSTFSIFQNMPIFLSTPPQ